MWVLTDDEHIKPNFREGEATNGLADVMAIGEMLRRVDGALARAWGDTNA